MLTNTLLIYMTQEALTKARQRLKARKDTTTDQRGPMAADTPRPWQNRRGTAKPRASLRH